MQVQSGFFDPIGGHPKFSIRLFGTTRISYSYPVYHQGSESNGLILSSPHRAVVVGGGDGGLTLDWVPEWDVRRRCSTSGVRSSRSRGQRGISISLVWLKTPEVGVVKVDSSAPQERAPAVVRRLPLLLLLLLLGVVG